MPDSQQLVFFFSSRRRHTRYWRDWSSDVCSSDLQFDPLDPDPDLRGNPPGDGRDLRREGSLDLHRVEAQAMDFGGSAHREHPGQVETDHENDALRADGIDHDQRGGQQRQGRPGEVPPTGQVGGDGAHPMSSSAVRPSETSWFYPDDGALTPVG